MAIPLREFRRLQPIQTPRRQIPMEQIIRTMGRSPAAEGMRVTGETVGKALQTTGNVIGQVLARKAEKRREGKELATMERLVGRKPGEFSNLPPQVVESVTTDYLKNQIKMKGVETEKQEELQKIRLLEKHAGVKSGAFGNDFSTARILFGQSKPAYRKHPSGRTEMYNRMTGDSLGFVEAPPEEIKSNRSFQQLFPIEQDRILKEREKFMSDKVIQELEQRLAKGSEINAMLAQNPRNAYGILAGGLTRYSGEVGRLTDEDIDRNIKPRDIAGKVKQALKLFKEGRFPEDRIEEMKIVLDIVREAAYKTFNRKVKNVVDSTSIIVPNVSQESLRQVIAGRSFLFQPLSNLEQLRKPSQGKKSLRPIVNLEANEKEALDEIMGGF